MRIVISSGHGLKVRGAALYLDEVNEARRVVDSVAIMLINSGHEAVAFHDDTSDSQDENLEAIVDFHNGQDRDLDVSVHFNAYQDTKDPMGTEVLYVTQEPLAERVAGAIASKGFVNRGAKARDDLYFLNNTERPAILIEVCFVDSFADSTLYTQQFMLVCRAIADALVTEDPNDADQAA